MQCLDPIAIVAIASGLLYCACYVIAHRKIMQIATHRKIWNAVLALSFAAVAATSIFYVLRSGFGMALPFNVSQIHNLSGTVFVIIGIFHALWHIPYFAAYLPKGEKK
ncbi:Uncharacterised protein [uncultured archaeon]|nr:Uncharacterised protein [uncultured archaeon]